MKEHLKTNLTEYKERPLKRRKLLQLIRLFLLGSILVFAKGDTENPPNALLKTSTSVNPKALYDETSNVINQSENLAGQRDDTNNESLTENAPTKPESIPILLENSEEIEDGSIESGNNLNNTTDANSAFIDDNPLENQSVATASISFGEGVYVQYIIDNYHTESVGIPLNDNNYFVLPHETNAVIQKVFTNDPFTRGVVSLFYPEKSDVEITAYLNYFHILIGEQIDYYLTEVRSGSWGTTVAVVTADGQLKFETISLRSDLVSSSYIDDEWGSLTRLVREEFFQAHQYNNFATLFNTGYLSEVADIKTVDDMIESVSNENIRAFLELFPQQKILTDSGAGGNAYNFYVGNKFFGGYPAANTTVDAAYNEFTSFVETKLEIPTTPDSFLDPNFIIEINDAFREKYSVYYSELGFHEDKVNIWNLIGMKRTNPSNPLDMPALLPIPIN